MPILLDANNKHLKAKVLAGPRFSIEKTQLARAPGRIPIYSRGDEFQHWQIPIDGGLSYVIQTFGKDNIITTETSQPLLDRYLKKSIKIDDLPREVVSKTVYGSRELEPHQIDIVSINKQKGILLIAAETGTGKTISTLARADHLGSKSILIIGPKKLRTNWRTEVRETLDKQCLIYWGDKKAREKLKTEIPKYDIIYTTFEQLEEFSKYDIEFDQIIVDEIHLVCNDKTKTFKSLNKVLRSHSGGILGLSATPSRMGMSEFWGVLYLIDPDFAGSKSNFLSRYEEVLATMTVRKNGRPFKIPIKVRAKNQEELQERLKSIMVRVKKDKVLDFRDNIEIIETELTNRQKTIYEEALSQIRLELSDKSLDIANPLTRLLRLLQISEGLFNVSEKYDDSGKLEYLHDELRDLGDEKAVIWSRFLPIVQRIYDLNPAKTVRYSGNQNDAMKQLAVWAFNGVKTAEDEAEYFRLKSKYPEFKFNPGEAQFFVGTHSLKSGIGINLQKARLCYFTSYDYNPAAIMQARDRISRIGQEQDTLTKFIVSTGTIERRVLQTILRHYRNSIELLDGKKDDSFRLTSELMQILAGD